MASITTVYENVKSDFYSVERAGYTTVSAAVFDTVTDMINHGFTLSSVQYLDTVSNTKKSGTWPISIPLQKIDSKGTGYLVNDELVVVGGTGSESTQVKVSTVDPRGSITGITFTKTGNYSILPTSPAELAYVDPDFSAATFKLSLPVTSSNGAVSTSSVPGSTSVSVIETYKISTAVIDGSYQLTPASVAAHELALANIAARTSSVSVRSYNGGDIIFSKTTNITSLTDIKLGRQLFGPSSISAGVTVSGVTPFTAVTAIGEWTVDDGLSSLYIGRLLINFEIAITASATITKETGTKIQVSAPITAAKDDILKFRGYGATIDNTAKQIPNAWTAILEAGAAVDPLNDSVGTNGTVVESTVDSNIVTIENVIGNPIRAGQLVTSTLELGSVFGVVTVLSANVTGDITTVTLSSLQTFPNAGEPLKFIFAQTQPWRIAFDVQDSQTVLTYAATELQLANDGTIAKIPSPVVGSGQYLDQSGLMGDFPTGVGSPITITGQGDIKTGILYKIIKEKGSSDSDQVFPVGTYAAPSIADLSTSGSGVDIYGKPLVEGQLVGKIFVAQTVELDKLTKAGATSLFTNKTTTVVSQLTGTVNKDNLYEGFLNRGNRVLTNPQAYPLNYAMTITNRGIFFGMWEGTWSTMQKTKAATDNFFNWFLVQRPVNRKTGEILTTGVCPVFCINSVGYKYWKFVVRESDVMHPSQGDPTLKSFAYNETTRVSEQRITPFRVPAEVHSEDSFAVLNTSNQISLTEDKKYLIGFLYNLTTPRFRYSEELDMIGQVSADVVGAGTDISIAAYKESGPRKYLALPASGIYNSGMRIAVLKDTPTLGA